MKKVAVIHFMPLEFYPPTTNFLDAVCKVGHMSIKVWSTNNNKGREVYTNKALSSILRTTLPSLKNNALVRLIRYLIFNFNCLVGLFIFKPHKIVYYESYSAWPVFIYLKFFGAKKELFIHFHEYFSPAWYVNGMRLVKYYHSLEQKYLFKRAIWISQTNKDRLNMFKDDNRNLETSKLNIFPNYPPQKWVTGKGPAKKEFPLKSVYIGSISLKASYFREYCEWVKKMAGKVIFHIYGYNYDANTLDYLKSIDSIYIKFFEGGIEYNEIPKTLHNYDFGLILYKALTQNYKYNESNKLFEYLACGLSVLYSDKMLGIKGFDPKNVMSLNFESLDAFDYTKLLDMESPRNQSDFSSERASEAIIEQLTS